MKNFFASVKNLNFVRLLNLSKLQNPALYLLLFIAFIILNFTVAAIPARFDFSYGKTYTLSSSTKKILNNLDDIVTIKFFASSDIPTKLLPLKNQIVDLLNEYQRDNPRRVVVKVLDPKTDQNALNDVKDFGIPQIQFSQLEQDKYAVSASYFGIGMSYLNKKEIIPQVTNIGSMEYNVTAAIYKMTNKQAIKVAVMGRTQSFDPNSDDLLSFDQALQKQFDLSFINVSTESATKVIDPSYKTVFVFDDTSHGFDDQEIAALKKYLDNKGKVIFFLDGVWVEQSLTTVPSNNNLFSLLDQYGIKLNQNLVLSANAELVNFGNSQVSFLSPYPFWLRANDFDQQSTYFSNINQLTYPWASSLTLEKKNNMIETALVKTSKQSWTQSGTFELNPQNIPQPSSSDLKQFTVTAEAKQKNGGTVMVIPSSRFILEQFLSRTSDNLEFVLNVVNDYASGGALSGISQHAVAYYPLPSISENMKNAFKYGNILLLPALLALYGAYTLLKRK